MDLSHYEQHGYSRGRAGWIILLWWLVQATLFRCSPYPLHGFRRALLRLFGAKIGRNVLIRADAKFYFPWRVEIGDFSWIGSGVMLYSLERITVGAHCVISQEAYLNTGNHDIAAPHFDLIVKPIVIQDHVWVGTRAFVNLGVTIHDGAVIGAMSVVTKDMPANMVCVGNPCRPCKARTGAGLAPNLDHEDGTAYAQTNRS